MPKACQPNLPEHLKGVGVCQIDYEVKRRTGKPNWWCKTHQLDAAAPDGMRMERCPGAIFDAVPVEHQLVLDVTKGVFSVWGGVPPAIQIGVEHGHHGNVHVHHRPAAGAPKDLDDSFDIVYLRNGGQELIVENMAAVAFSITELAGQPVTALRCPKASCGGVHIDEQKFATFPHSKHLCNRCGRNFRDRTPSISNPLAEAYNLLLLTAPPDSALVDRPLEINSADYSSISIWPTNSPIVTNTQAAQDAGIHVHAWDHDGTQVLDETYWPVILDGDPLDEVTLRALAVQRAVSHDVPILSMPCADCGTSILSPSTGWIEPNTRHTCPSCGGTTKTRRRVFLNPLAEKSRG